MSAPLPCRVPSESARRNNIAYTSSDWVPLGKPSPGLVARSEQGLEKFLRRCHVDQDEKDDER